ncbi:MAG: hypothetical protein RIS47_860 [Bacteroidota bacterium]
MAAAGYPLVVLAFGSEINWNLLYFNRITSVCWHGITPLWATATIRASSVGSTICNAVSTQGKPNAWPSAMGHSQPPRFPKAPHPEEPLRTTFSNSSPTVEQPSLSIQPHSSETTASRLTVHVAPLPTILVCKNGLVPHGRRPTGGFAQRTYGVGLKNSRHGLARIVAVAHSGVMPCQQADVFRLKYIGFQLISLPNARTTSG